MGRMKKAFVLLSIMLSCHASSVLADSHENIKKEYPSDSYIVGIAEVPSSGDNRTDKTRERPLQGLK